MALLIVSASALLLAAAWASWRWQHASSTRCGREPADTTPAADQAHQAWQRCQDRKQADRAVPAALAVFAITVAASGVVVAFIFRPSHRWVRSDVR
jgi:hypothetical protein